MPPGNPLQMVQKTPKKTLNRSHIYIETMGTLRFKPIARKNPQNKVSLWYLEAVYYSQIGKAETIECAARNSQIPRAYMEQIYDALVTEIKNFVMNGHSIQLDGLGTFSSVLQYRPGVDRREDATTGGITKVAFRFRPSASMMKYFNNSVSLERMTI